MNIDLNRVKTVVVKIGTSLLTGPTGFDGRVLEEIVKELCRLKRERNLNLLVAVSYTHLRAHETVLDLVCRLLLEKKKHYTRYCQLPSQASDAQ